MKEITFNCPACDYPLTVPASAAGQSGPCPECGEVITGPGPDPDEETAPDPAPDSPKEEPEPKAAPDPEIPGRREEPAPTGPPAAPSPRRLGLGTVAVLLILSSIACFSLGYQLGRTSTTPAPQTKTHDLPDTAAPGPKGPDTPTAPAPPDPQPLVTTDPTPEPAPVPVNPPAPAPAEEATPDKAALLTFLSAADWIARRDLVLHADHVAPQMESLSTTLGDGPITTDRISYMHRTPTSVVYQVTTAEHPNGFPVALELVDDRWLVDWPGFAEFRYKLFPSFLSDKTRSTGTFRLLIKPELAGLGDTGRQPYSASTPDMAKPVTIYAAENSKEYQTLEDIIGALAAKAPASFRQLMESGGVPFILKLSKTADDDETILMIDRIAGQGWSPREPETPDS